MSDPNPQAGTRDAQALAKIVCRLGEDLIRLIAAPKDERLDRELTAKTNLQDLWIFAGELPGLVTWDEASAPDAAPDVDPGLIEVLRSAGDRWGPLGVALAAARLTDVDVLVRQLTEDANPAEEEVPEPTALAGGGENKLIPPTPYDQEHHPEGAKHSFMVRVGHLTKVEQVQPGHRGARQ